MSFDATLWGLKDAPAKDTEERVLLTIMGEAASEDGTACYLAQATMAKRAVMADRTVRRRLAEMEARGVIARGDQTLVAHLRPDQRPIVWDLMIPYAWFPNIDRVNENRARAGLPPLTPQNRPDLTSVPEKKKRADVGQPKPRKKVESDTGDATGLVVRPSGDPETGLTTGLVVRPDSQSRTTGLVVHSDRTCSPTNQSLTQSLNPKNPPAAADAGPIHNVQATIDGQGEELAPKTETPEQRAFGIARGWVDYRASINKPIAANNPLHAVKDSVIQFVKAGYTDDEIKRAINGLGEALPSKSMMQRALDTIRDREQPGVNGRPKQRGAGARVTDHWDRVAPVSPAAASGSSTTVAPKRAAEIQTTGAFW